MPKGSHRQSTLVAAKFVEVTSKAGNKYFRGEWGGMGMHLVKSGKVDAESGGSVWELIVSESRPPK